MLGKIPRYARNDKTSARNDTSSARNEKQLKAEGEGDSDASASFQPASFRGQDGRAPFFLADAWEEAFFIGLRGRLSFRGCSALEKSSPPDTLGKIPRCTL